MAATPKPVRKVTKEKQAEFRHREKKELPNKAVRKMATKVMSKTMEGSAKGKKMKLFG
jgi:hypothetical protein